jgi:3-keto-disaccharide hydrolase
MHLLRLVLAGSLLLVTSTDAQTGWRSLWNGKDLSGWTTWLARPEPGSDVPGLKRDANGRYAEPIGSNRDPLKVFTVVSNVDGQPAMRISGEVFGEIRTKESFKDYHLKFQFKWGEKKWAPRDAATTPRDSGLLYHVHAEPGAEGRTWARSIELQIQEHDVGDLYAIGSAIAVRAKPRAGTKPALFEYDPAGEWTFFSQSQGMSGRCVKMPDNEKPTGEWNTVELVAFRDEAIHIVNGRVVMRLHSPMRIDSVLPTPVTSGPIILQSEGAELFYRDIQVRPITAVPAEFAK